MDPILFTIVLLVFGGLAAGSMLSVCKQGATKLQQTQYDKARKSVDEQWRNLG